MLPEAAPAAATEAAHGPCLDSDCGCVPDFAVARSCCFVASYNDGPMMADSRRVRPACVEALWASGVVLWAHPRVSGCGSPHAGTVEG